jgi:predicted metal-dependent hydrolase
MNNWCDNSQVYTRFYDALSVLFPAWEKAFVAVAKTHLENVQDPYLKQRLEQFIKEELAHASAHDAYNARAGLIEDAELQYKKAKIVHLRPNSKLWLGAMVSIEHLAVCFARMILDLHGQNSGREHNLFAWHSREEIGHKDLAIDVWRNLGYSDSDLRAIARQNQVYVLKFIVGYTYQRTNFSSLKDYLDFAHWAWHMTTKVCVPMLKIYLPNFHPNKVDDSRYLEATI